MPDLYHWAQLFRATTWEEILMLAEKNENIKECIVTLKELTEDEKIQLECEARERSRLDYLAATRYGYKQGHEEGRAVEREQGIYNLVSTLKDLNIPDADIIDKLVEKYELTSEEAAKHLDKFSKIS